MTIGELLPGDHTVTFENDLGSVSSEGGHRSGRASLAHGAYGHAGGHGGVRMAHGHAPLVVDLHENGRLVGNSGIDKIMLPAGRHEIELVNEDVDFRETRTVQVSPGRTSAITVTPAKGNGVA